MSDTTVFETMLAVLVTLLALYGGAGALFLWLTRNHRSSTRHSND